MAETITVARPYAVAAWRHAEAEGKADLWADMLELMADVARDETMATIIGDPRIDADRLTQLMLDVCGGRINEEAENFVRLLVDNGKLSLMSEISSVYMALKSEAGGAVDATLLAAYPVNAKFEQAIAAAMQKKLSREVKFTTEEDKSLLGGVIVRVGDMVIDASIRGQIESLASELRQ
jgi:F-type H+-transporting ATPase subunit delta